MRALSVIGLSIMVCTASCVPPKTARVASPAAEVAQAQPVRFVSPGPWLPAMPMPLAPAQTAPAPLETAALAPASPFTPTAQTAADAGRALDCLTAAIYYEARSESVDGQRAVAQVVLNRVRNPAFPGSVCGVVYQGSDRATGCQFTFTCDGSLLARREPAAWERAQLVARAALAGDVYAPVGLSTYYHTTAVHPWWAPSLTPVTTIGAHIFYRWPGSWGGAAAFRQAYAGTEPSPTMVGAAGPDSDGVIRFAVADGSTVSIHRGGIGASTGGAPVAMEIAGVRVHRGMPGATETTPTADGAATTMVADASGDDAAAVHVHVGNGAGTGMGADTH